MAKEPKPELIAETTAPTLLDPSAPTVAVVEKPELKTVDYWARQRGHVNPPQHGRHHDPRLDRGFVLACVKAHERFLRAKNEKHASIIAVDSASGNWEPAEITGEQYDALVLDRFPALPTKGDDK